MFNIAVLVSGTGTNLQAVINYTKRQDVEACVKVVLADREGAFAIERARAEGIESL